MSNNERLETILKIREIRNKLDSLNCTNEEKEIIRLSLNYYEEDLDIEIARFNKEIKVLEEEGITSNNKEVNVPIEEANNKYKEYANSYSFNISEVLSKLLNELNNKEELKSFEKEIILKSLKEYCLYLERLQSLRKNNEIIYGDEYKDNSK